MTDIKTYYKEEKKNVFMNTDNKTYYINDDKGCQMVYHWLS